MEEQGEEEQGEERDAHRVAAEGLEEGGCGARCGGVPFLGPRSGRRGGGLGFGHDGGKLRFGGGRRKQGQRGRHASGAAFPF
jgi:hypothetical protein